MASPLSSRITKSMWPILVIPKPSQCLKIKREIYSFKNLVKDSLRIIPSRNKDYFGNFHMMTILLFKVTMELAISRANCNQAELSVTIT